MNDHFIPPDHDTPPSVDEAVEQTEGQIQKLLLDLAEFADKEIDHVSVDTRNFANLRVEIQLNK